MASVDCRKMTAKACSGMMYHLDDEKRKGVHHSNKHINKELTHLNSWVGCSNFSEMKENMNRNVAEIDSASPPRREKDDRNINISFYMVCPKELTDAGLSEEFFEKLYGFIGIFCEKKYGKAYPCGMAVHRDEIHEYLDHGWDKRMSLEHGHMWVTPYAKWIDQRTVYGEDGKPLREAPTEEEKAKNPKAKGKIVKESYTAEGLNAKHFLNKTFLKELQQEVDAFIFQEYGIHYLTNETPLNMTVEELKLKSEQAAAMLDRAEHEAAAIVKEAEIEAEQIRKKNQELSDQNEILEKSIQDKKTEESNIDTRLEQKTAKEKALDANISTMEGTIDTLNTQKSNIEAEITEKKQERTVLEGSLNEFNQQITDAKADLKQIKDERYQIASKTMSMKMQRSEIEDDLKKKNDVLVTVTSTLQTKNAELETVEADLEEKKTTKKDLEDTIEVLKTQIAGIEIAKNNAMGQAEDEVKSIYREANEKAETIKSDAKTKADEIISEANETANNILQTAYQNADVQALQKENEKLKKENTWLRSLIERFHHKVDCFYADHKNEPFFGLLSDIIAGFNKEWNFGKGPVVRNQDQNPNLTSNLGH